MRVAPIDQKQLAEQGAVSRATHRLAESELGDEEAKHELQAAIAAHPSGVEPALRLVNRRNDYLSDRSYRLLRAAADDSPVEPIPAESAELFRREEELGRMPIKDAFALLANLEPALGDMERNAQAGRLKTRGRRGTTGSADVPLGAAWNHDDPLLRSNLALSIACHYLEVIAGNDQLADVDTPYFAPSRKRVSFSGILFGRPQDPPERRG